MLTLPNDILLLVGDYLDDHQDRYNLVFVCQRFHDLFLRVLYRSAELKSCSQTQSFLGGLLRRPELARVVQSLAFDNWEARSSSSSSPSSPSSPSSSPSTSSIPITHTYSNPLCDDFAPFSQWAQSISHSQEEHTQWEQDLLSGVEEAWIALLLTLVNNIRQLRLIYPKKNRYLDRTLHRVIGREASFHNQPAFPVLQEVSLSHLDDGEDTRGSFSPSQIIPFFRLPSMRVFSADSVIEPQEDEQHNQQPSSEPLQTNPETNSAATAGSSSVSHITLNSSNGSQGMASLLASCSGLESFKYQHSDNHLYADGYQPTAFARSLAASESSLHTLWLDNCGQHLPFTFSGLNESHDEWFGPLTNFTALKYLRIRLPNLLDVRYSLEPSVPLTEVLPRSVETLYVEGCKENSLAMLLRQLQLVLGERKKRFVGLHRLDIEGFFHEHDEDEERGGSGDSPSDIAGEGAGAGEQRQEKVIKPRVYAMVESLRSACLDAGVELHLRDRACVSTMT